ncbi:MAG TPA: nucleotide sugar dehydrogenase [Candidatus Elarobacter sp.]|nr:nucleotide sugar dehydrogenase [Candidatus Elarobacter sp.]
MKIVVSGLWHLGCVTAACLAERYDVVAHDPDPGVVAALGHGEPPIFEPGLAELLSAGVRAGRLAYTSDDAAAADADVAWIAHDTPVDENDVPGVAFVADHTERIVRRLRPGTLVVIASQVPVGFVARMERRAAELGVAVSFASVPENLRLGEALAIYRRPDRIVAGVRSDADRERLGAILAPFSTDVVWMSPESAEMTKHALNAFLATSVTFINEIAGVCERVDADVKDVERGLRTESRIGPRAYVSAGGGFAGGTLARDVRALTAVAEAERTPHDVLAGVLTTNALQQRWTDRALERELGAVRGARIAILGLTYKPGTDTLRRSDAVALARRLSAAGASVVAFDPAVRALPADLAGVIEPVAGIDAALDGADAVVIGTAWPEFRALGPARLRAMRRALVVDPRRFLEGELGGDAAIRYVGVGRPSTTAGPTSPSVKR